MTCRACSIQKGEGRLHFPSKGFSCVFYYLEYYLLCYSFSKITFSHRSCYLLIRDLYLWRNVPDFPVIGSMITFVFFKGKVAKSEISGNLFRIQWNHLDHFACIIICCLYFIKSVCLTMNSYSNLKLRN